MANSKILSPMVEEYVLVVSIPLEAPIDIVKDQKISEAEKYFISMRDKENNHGKKVEFARARVLMKWASACNAHLVDMHSADHKLIVSLGFTTLKSLIEFQWDMSPIVSMLTTK